MLAGVPVVKPAHMRGAGRIVWLVWAFIKIASLQNGGNTLPDLWHWEYGWGTNQLCGFEGFRIQSGQDVRSLQLSTCTDRNLLKKSRLRLLQKKRQRWLDLLRGKKKNHIPRSDCKQSSFYNVLHWLMLQWAPSFEGLDVWLKGLARRISRMFPISLQPNRADRQQNRACLCLAHFTIPNIYLCLYPVFIICKVMRAAADTELWGQINERPTPNYCCPNSYTWTMTEAGGGVEQRPAGFFFPPLLPLSLSLQRQWTQMAIARAGHQILWTAPNGWAMSLPVVTGNSNWESGSCEK